MTYKFGQYDVQIIRVPGGIFLQPSYTAWLRFQNEIIASEAHFGKERFALSWAESEIRQHKENFARLTKLSSI